MEPIYKTEYGDQRDIDILVLEGRTIIIRDRSFEMRNYQNQYEAMGTVDTWVTPTQVQRAMEKVDSDRYHFPKLIGSIRQYDGGAFDIEDFHDPYEAIGFATIWCQNNLKMIEFMIEQLKDFPKMPCHVVIHDGGEYEPRCFRNTYQCLGFMNVNCSPGAANKMRFLIANVKPEKFSKDFKFTEEMINTILAGVMEGMQ
ncbi:hypothetical protein KKH23_11165 [Patescibacteria group bacterium]|nr:hypothetical protein [Patescibacteria group bacterium]